MELKKVTCSEIDLKALKLIYYFVLVSLSENKKGLAYRDAFKFQKRLNSVKKDLKKYNIDELLEVI